MGIQLDENAYQKLIDENIEALNKYMPEHSLEKKHTIEVLKWSVQQIYHHTQGKTSCENSTLPILMLATGDEFIEKYKDLLCFVPLSKILEAFFYFIKDDETKVLEILWKETQK
jgi:hypothetical protein